MDLQRYVRDRQSTTDEALVVNGEKSPSTPSNDSTLKNLLSLLGDKSSTMWHELVQKEFAMLFDFVLSSVHNMVPALKLAIGVTLDMLATETEQGKATPIPLGKPDPAAEQARLKALWRALDADCSGYLSMGEFGKFMRSGESADARWGSACQQRKVQNAREHVINERKQKKVA